MTLKMSIQIKEISAETADAVDQHIKRVSRPAEDESLMPFVRDGVEQDEKKRAEKMPAGPLVPAVLDGAEKKDHQNQIFRQMRRLAGEKMTRVCQRVETEPSSGEIRHVRKKINQAAPQKDSDPEKNNFLFFGTELHGDGVGNSNPSDQVPLF